MDYNKFSYYRANPFAKNDFVLNASMDNRKKKQFPSEIPQGEEHYPLKSGKRIFKEKVSENQIEKDKILNSPERYPFENRIAMDKSYSRNLDTIDIEGASSGTKVSESIRNKHKAIQELRRRNHQEVKSPLLKQTLDQVYEKQRRGLAQKFQKNVQMRKTKQSFSKNSSNNDLPTLHQGGSNYDELHNSRGVNAQQLQRQYDRYVSHNSNKKYQSVPSNSYQYQGFQRYKRPEKIFQTLDHYNHGRIPQHPPFKRQNNQAHQRYQSIDHGYENRNYQTNQSPKITNVRGPSIDMNNPAGRPVQDMNMQGNPSYINNSNININNRHRSNPQYVQNYPTELQKRVDQVERNKQIQTGLKNIYEMDRVEFRRHNPTNLSFNIAAKSSLMGPII